MKHKMNYLRNPHNVIGNEKERVLVTNTNEYTMQYTTSVHLPVHYQVYRLVHLVVYQSVHSSVDFLYTIWIKWFKKTNSYTVYLFSF